MKKTILYIVSICLLFFSVAIVMPARTYAAQQCTVELDISLRQNVLMAKYDVEIYFDGVYQKTVMHGETVQIVVEAEEGYHDIHFYKEGNQLVNGNTIIFVDENVIMNCELANHERYIEAKLPGESITEAKSETYGGFQYHINEEGNIIIDKYTGSASVLRVPGEIDGHPVTEIGPQTFRKNTSLQEIELPEGLEKIDEEAFDLCLFLNKINIPGTVKYLGDRAFGYCGSLETIKLPPGLDMISTGLFQGCTKLTDISIPGGVRFIGDSAFFMCRLETISIPSSVKGIGVSAFDSCILLENIWIPSNVQCIGSYAFAKCSRLSAANIPGEVEVVEEGLFNGDYSLEDLEISYGIISIEPCAFKGCSYLTDIELPASVKNIGKDAFQNCKSLSVVTIPESVEYIHPKAFRNCTPVLQVERGSYAAGYAMTNELTIQYEE